MMGGRGVVVLYKKISITQRERYVWTLSVRSVASSASLVRGRGAWMPELLEP